MVRRQRHHGPAVRHIRCRPGDLFADLAAACITGSHACTEETGEASFLGLGTALPLISRSMQLASKINRLDVRVKMFDTPVLSSDRWRFQTAMVLALAADALQIFVLPLFSEGALSPA